MSEADRFYRDEPKNSNSSALLQMFVISLGLLAAYGCGYALMNLLFHGAETGSLLTVWLPPFLMGTVVSAIVCIPMRFLKNKHIIPGAMAFLLLLYLVLVVAFLNVKTVQDPMLDIYIISLYALPCLIPGNAVSWSIYWKLRD